MSSIHEKSTPKSDLKICLGIETSCDETAVAVVRSDGAILSHLVLSQLDAPQLYGGVVPELAARAHMDHLDTLLNSAACEAGIGFADLDAVAATCGPGLIGGVIVGMMAGKAIAASHDLPFIGVNHLEAHALTPRLTHELAFPYLLLLVSGGHTQIIAVEDVGVYRNYGTTLDDAMGEAFDKSAKLMGLPYPGGPEMEKLAALCRDKDSALSDFPLPRPLLGRKDCNFSFSGLKTAVRNHVEAFDNHEIPKDKAAAIACSFQEAVADIAIDRCKRGIEQFFADYPDEATRGNLVVSGGVAANQRIRSALLDLTNSYKMDFIAPPVKLCTDNGAMIAWAGLERLNKGLTDTLDMPARPRWPLEDLTG